MGDAELMRHRIEWHPTDDEEVHDLWVDGRVAEYDVHKDDREDALWRARVNEEQ